jgi:hypothetical protein
VVWCGIADVVLRGVDTACCVLRIDFFLFRLHRLLRRPILLRVSLMNLSLHGRVVLETQFAGPTSLYPAFFHRQVASLLACLALCVLRDGNGVSNFRLVRKRSVYCNWSLRIHVYLRTVCLAFC